MELDLTLAKKPSIFRRLGAMLYDTLLLSGVLMVAIGIIAVPYGLVTGSELYVHYRFLEQIYILVVIAAFYVYFWTHGGQTLGMRAWRLRVIGEDGRALGFGAAVKRFIWAIPSLLPAGLGLWVSLFNRDGLAWHDRKSCSRLVMLQPSAK